MEAENRYQANPGDGPHLVRRYLEEPRSLWDASFPSNAFLLGKGLIPPDPPDPGADLKIRMGRDDLREWLLLFAAEMGCAETEPADAADAFRERAEAVGPDGGEVTYRVSVWDHWNRNKGAGA